MGQNKYGMGLVNGECVEEGVCEAARYYKMVADQGHAGCQFKYGTCVYDGKGVEKDLSEAARYLKMAAERRMALLDRSKTLISL